MNKQRRKQIEAIIAELESVEIALEEVKEAECECLNNMPEGIRDSAKGEALENAADNLEDALDYIESSKGSLQEAIE